MIINSHVHLNTNENYFFYNNYGFVRFLEEMCSNGISMSFPTLNPKLELFLCTNDCAFYCNKTNGSINRNLNICNCNVPNRHRVCIHEKNGKLAISCKTCGKLILESDIDPLRKYNLELISITKPYRDFIKPILYLSLCRATLQKEIQFFEKNYNNDFVGFKFHPWNDQVNVAKFKVNTAKPILIHTGIRNLESATHAINFAKNNPKLKVVIAHAASLNLEVLKNISIMKNVFIDCCPSEFMFRNRFSCLTYPNDILSPEDIYYKVLSIVPSNKILFGTDSPWGNSKQELEIVRNLKISSSIREQILWKNSTMLYLR